MGWVTMAHWIVRAVGAVLVAVGAGCARPGAKPPAPPPKPEQPPSVQEKVLDFPGEAPANPPTSTPPPAPSQPAAPAAGEQPKGRAGAVGLHEFLPGVRADLGAKLVEFDGVVPIDCHNPRTPDVYLEVTVCTPDTKEHESLVMTKVKAASVHAALLAAGLEPGAPGQWKWEQKKLVPVPARGPGLEVRLAYNGADGRKIEAPATDWIVNATSKAPFVAPGDGTGADRGWVFAGSRMVSHEGKEFYDADGVGTLVGLCTFGSETIAWKRVISPDSNVDEPEWIADPAKVPAYGTPVTVRIRAIPAK
jgi:hypothetical protein